MTYLRAELLILIPLLNTIGFYLKGKKSTDASGVATYPNAVVKTKHIPLILICAAVAIATVYGFVTSAYTGWRMVLDAVVMTGMLQGTLAACAAMGLYDTAKTAVKE